MIKLFKPKVLKNRNVTTSKIFGMRNVKISIIVVDLMGGFFKISKIKWLQKFYLRLNIALVLKVIKLNFIISARTIIFLWVWLHISFLTFFQFEFKSFSDDSKNSKKGMKILSLKMGYSSIMAIFVVFYLLHIIV